MRLEPSGFICPVWKKKSSVFSSLLFCLIFTIGGQIQVQADDSMTHIWTNSSGFIEAKACQLNVDSSHGLAVSKFYSSRGKKSNFEYLRSSSGGKQYNLANYSLVRPVSDVNSQQRIQVEVVAGSSTPGFRYNSYSARRNYGSKWGPNRKTRQKLFIFEKSLNEPKEYVFQILNRSLNTSIGTEVSSLDRLYLQSLVDSKSGDYIKLICDGKDYYLFNVFEKDGEDFQYRTRIGVYSDETKVLSSFRGIPLSEIDGKLSVPKEDVVEKPDQEELVKKDQVKTPPEVKSTPAPAVDIHDTSSSIPIPVPRPKDLGRNPQPDGKKAVEDREQKAEPGSETNSGPVDSPSDSPGNSPIDSVDELLDYLHENGEEPEPPTDSQDTPDSGDEVNVMNTAVQTALPIPLWKNTKWMTKSGSFTCSVESVSNLSTIRLSGSTPRGKELFENFRDKNKKAISKVPVFSIVRLQKDMRSVSSYKAVKVLTLSTNSKTDPNEMAKIGDTNYLHEESLYSLDLGVFEMLNQSPTRMVPGASGELAGKYVKLSLDGSKPKLLTCTDSQSKERVNHIVFDLVSKDKKKEVEFAVEIDSLGEFFADARGMPKGQIGQSEESWANDGSKWLPKSTVSQSLSKYNKTSLPKKISDGAYWFVNYKKRALCRARGGSYCSRTGYCLRGVKWALLKAGIFSSYPGGVSAYAFGPSMRGRGMKNIYADSSHKAKIRKSMANVPHGCAVVYSPTQKARSRCAWKRKRRRSCGGDKHGHIEVRTTRNQFVSDFIQRASMRSMNGAYRYITGVYCKM